MIEIKIDMLLHAIENKIVVELRPAEKSHENILFFSKLLACDEEKKGIVIDFPIASSELMALKLAEAVVIKFIYTDSPFFFNSNILDLAYYLQTEEPDKRRMLLAMPETIFGEERRGYLKLNTPPFAVTVKVIKSTDMAKHLSQRTYKSVAVNISGGGIAIENMEGKLPLTVGDIVSLSVSLPENAVTLEGEVLNVYPFENSERVSFGIRFMQRNMDTLNYKRNVKAITHYVMRRERELLSKR